jgi:hypothetical protein
MDEKSKEMKTVPMDSKGRFCGEGELEDYPYLYLLNFDFPLKSVCVKECPNLDYRKLQGKDGIVDTPKLRAERRKRKQSAVGMDYQRFTRSRNSRRYFSLSLDSKPAFYL